MVDPAVDLEDQPKAVTGEVGEVGPDGMLSSKPVAVDPPLSQASPQSLFSQARALALRARKSCAATGHGAT